MIYRISVRYFKDSNVIQLFCESSIRIYHMDCIKMHQNLKNFDLELLNVPSITKIMPHNHTTWLLWMKMLGFLVEIPFAQTPGLSFPLPKTILALAIALIEDKYINSDRSDGVPLQLLSRANPLDAQSGSMLKEPALITAYVPNSLHDQSLLIYSSNIKTNNLWVS